jgi:hypothetical protein
LSGLGSTVFYKTFTYRPIVFSRSPAAAHPSRLTPRRGSRSQREPGGRMELSIFTDTSASRPSPKQHFLDVSDREHAIALRVLRVFPTIIWS